MKIGGKEIASQIFEETAKSVGKLKEKDIVPHLAIILVGNDPASETYVRQKKLKGEAIGARVTVLNYESGIRNLELIKTIEQLNNDNNIHGIIIQRPLPQHIDPMLINQSVDPQKDVDAFQSSSPFKMPLAAAVLIILEHIYNSINKNDQKFIDWLRIKNIIVMGKGQTGGRPTIESLKQLGVEPLIIDSKTQNSEYLIKQADIIICAVGKPRIIQPQMLKHGVILIAVGMFKGTDGKLHGDYEEEGIKDIASFYTPIPGGVGPINVAFLLTNLIQACELQQT